MSPHELSRPGKMNEPISRSGTAPLRSRLCIGILCFYSETVCIFINLQNTRDGGLIPLNLALPEAPLSRDRKGALARI